jgi:hypothetical protein
MLLAKIDELVAIATRTLEETRAATEQLAPERARSCRKTNPNRDRRPTTRRTSRRHLT